MTDLKYKWGKIIAAKLFGNTTATFDAVECQELVDDLEASEKAHQEAIKFHVEYEQELCEEIALLKSTISNMFCEKIAPEERVVVLLTNALRSLTPEQQKHLADALIDRNELLQADRAQHVTRMLEV